MRQRLLTVSLFLILLSIPLSSQGQSVLFYKDAYFEETTDAEFEIDFPDDDVYYVIVDNTGVLTGQAEDRSDANYTLDVDYQDYESGTTQPPPVDEVISTINGGDDQSYESFLKAGEFYVETINDTFDSEDLNREIRGDLESNSPLTFFLTNGTGYESFVQRVDNYTGSEEASFISSTVVVALLGIPIIGRAIRRST